MNELDEIFSDVFAYALYPTPSLLKSIIDYGSEVGPLINDQKWGEYYEWCEMMEERRNERKKRNER